MATFPERALAALNGALVRIADASLTPLLDLPAFFSLLLIALPTAALIVAVMAGTTDQAAVRQTRRGIYAALLEIRLFNDDPRAVLRAVSDAMRHNLAYLRLSFAPFLILSVPLVLLLTHLSAFYGYTGLRPGATALIKVEPRTTGPAPDLAWSLEVPDAIRVESGPVHLVGEREVLWRITPLVEGDFLVRIAAGKNSARAAVDKTLHVSDAPNRRSPVRVLPGVLGQLSYPSEPPLAADGPLSSVSVTYPDATVAVLGAGMHWMIVFIVLTVGWAVILARAFGVSL